MAARSGATKEPATAGRAYNVPRTREPNGQQEPPKGNTVRSIRCSHQARCTLTCLFATTAVQPSKLMIRVRIPSSAPIETLMALSGTW